MPPSFPDRMPKHEARTHATYVLSGERLDPAAVTERLGIQPSWGAARGDRGERGIRRNLGVWGLGSWDLSTSDEPADHLRALMDTLEPAVLRVQQMVASEGLAARCWVVQRITPGRFGYTLEAGLLSRVLAVSASLEVSYLVRGFVEERA